MGQRETSPRSTSTTDKRRYRCDAMNFKTLAMLFLLPLAGFAGTPVVRAQTTKPSSTPSGAFEVQEWAIFIADPNQPRANAVSLFKSTLPEDANSRRVTD